MTLSSLISRVEEGSELASASVRPEPGKVEINGRHIRCSTCNGHGQRSVWSFGVKEPDECPDCGGSGRNWQYSRGAIARYYGGPLLGSGRNLADATKKDLP